MIARLGALCLLLAAFGSAAAAESGSVTGIWKTPIDGGSLVRIGSCGGALCGWLVTSPRLRANPDQRDLRNQVPSLRARRLSGLLVLKLQPLVAGKWGDGWAYNPENGALYAGTLQLKPQGVIGVTGCLMYPLCETQIWTRAG